MMHMRTAVLEASRQGLTLAEVAIKFAGARSHLEVVGTASDVADVMHHWLISDCCDGFNMMPPLAPEMLERFVDEVVPELQRRGIYRTAYEGATLRAHLGLPIPENRYAAARRLTRHAASST
jgi:alkanesulfonate monooxygenase SsuD/methylene tetrahydromethanopterin reductase-like flavin-dependent oxidoreductase (luciferase family)